MWLAKQKVVNPVMFVIADHQQHLADQRMERIRNKPQLWIKGEGIPKGWRD